MNLTILIPKLPKVIKGTPELCSEIKTATIRCTVLFVGIVTIHLAAVKIGLFDVLLPITVISFASYWAVNSFILLKGLNATKKIARQIESDETDAMLYVKLNGFVYLLALIVPVVILITSKYKDVISKVAGSA